MQLCRNNNRRNSNMSAFSESTLIRKFGALNASQQSIQTFSLWLIHHRRHHGIIVKTWMHEFKNAPEHKRLTFMYLANDIIQNSKKKGPEYGKEFYKALPNVFSFLGENEPSEDLVRSLTRLLDIWEERGVYDKKTIADYRSRLNDVDNSKIAAELIDADVNLELKKGSEIKKKRRRKHSVSAYSTDEEHSLKAESPLQVVLGDPPEAEELIQALMSLDNAASSDVQARERIANLPPEISDINCINKAMHRQEATILSEQIDEAIELITDYNRRLAAENEERTRLAVMLRDFHAEQIALLEQAQRRYEEYKQKVVDLHVVQKEISDHLNNLPDLTQLPDVTGGLAPLPSAGDLFNTYKR